MGNKQKKDSFNLENVLHKIRFESDKRRSVFIEISNKERSLVLKHLGRHSLYDLLNKLSDEEIVSALDHMDPDEIIDTLQAINKGRGYRIIALLSDEAKKQVRILSEFDSNTAGGLMNLDYIQVDENETLLTVTKKFKKHEKRTGRPPTIIVTRNGYISGYIPGHKLGFAKLNEKARKYVKRIPTIRHDAKKKKVLNKFKIHQHNKVVVVGEDGHIMGIIYSDEILKLLGEQESASLYDFAGLKNEESVSDGVIMKVKSRYKWLITNLATSFLAAFTVAIFDKTIAKYVLLAVYMPIVAGMGGNAAVQTLAVIVRGIALKKIKFKLAWPILRKEIGAALINGVINGVIVALVILFINRDIRMALILGLAMIINLLVAGVFGTMIPLIMDKLGKDPATSATIFITTATDVLGFLTFLGLASMFL